MSATCITAPNFICRSISLDADGDFIAWPAQICDAHGNGGPWRDALMDSHVDLVESGISRSFTEPEHLGHPPSDRNLRRDEAPIRQTSAIDG